MSQEVPDLAERLRKLQEELDFLKTQKTQEEFDEGARLHNEKNAPWINGQYSSMKFPPYVFRAFPRMLYNEQYEDACLQLAAAARVPGRGAEDSEREEALRVAERAKRDATCTVANEAELERRIGSGDWYLSPLEAYGGKQKRIEALATQAAHRAHDDRNMGELAKQEIEAFDDAAENFVAEIPVAKRGPGRPRKEA